MPATAPASSSDGEHRKPAFCADMLPAALKLIVLAKASMLGQNEQPKSPATGAWQQGPSSA